MARLPYVTAGHSGDVDAVYRRITGIGRPIVNLHRVLANQPAALEAFMGMSRYVRGGSSLEPAVRELMILATAYEFGQTYEITHHLKAARAAGVPDEKLAAVAPGGDIRALGARERLAAEFSQEAARTRTCGSDTFSKLVEEFGTDGAVDVVVTAAWYHLCAVILNSTDVDLETGNGDQT